jgi:hypothetical protein
MPRIGDFVERAPWSSDEVGYPKHGAKCIVSGITEIGGEIWVSVKDADPSHYQCSMPLYKEWVYWE